MSPAVFANRRSGLRRACAAGRRPTAVNGPEIDTTFYGMVRLPMVAPAPAPAGRATALANGDAHHG